MEFPETPPLRRRTARDGPARRLRRWLRETLDFLGPKPAKNWQPIPQEARQTNIERFASCLTPRSLGLRMQRGRITDLRGNPFQFRQHLAQRQGIRVFPTHRKI